MPDQQVPILTKPPEDTTEKVTEVMTELSKQTEFLSDTMQKNMKLQIKTEKKNDSDKNKSSSSKKLNNDIIKSSAKNITNASVNTIKLAQETFLGDISFVTEPLKKMGGIFGSLFSLKKKKTAPKRSAMLKTNPEAVYITDTLLKADKKSNLLDKFKGLLPMLLGGAGAGALVKTFGSMLMKAAPIAMIAGGLLWMAIDGIKGFFKAEEWGVSKTSATLGSILGGTGSGWKNAFANAGKWALLGAGIGMKVGGFMGLLVGGLAGAAIGGILGFIGGEKLAKGFDKIGSWFKNVFWGGIKKAAVSIGTWFKELPEMLISGFKEGWAQFKNELAGVSSFIDKISTVVNDIMEGIWISIKDVFAKIVLGISTFIDDPIGFGKKMLKGVIDKVSNLFADIKQGFADFINDPKQFITDLIQPIKDFFIKIGDIFKGMFNWLIGDGPEIDTEYVDKVKESSGYNSTLGIGSATTQNTSSGAWDPFTRTFKHNDVILRPDGSVHETSVDDTIIATKNPIAFADKESASATRDINNPVASIMSSVKSLIKELIAKQQTPLQSNMVQQNITSRYNPQSIMTNMTTEVF